MKNLLMISALLFICCLPIDAKENSGWDATSDLEIKLAIKYNNLLNTRRIQEAMSLVASDATFSDPTWGVFNQNKQTLNNAYSMSMESYKNTQYEIRNVTSGRGTVVIHMIASSDVDRGNSSPNGHVHIVTDFIRVLSIKEDKIFQHIDLVNYDKFMPSLMNTANSKQ